MLVEEKVRITPRHMKTLDLIAQGLSNREIAQALEITVRTVESHFHAISIAAYHLEIKNRVQMMLLHQKGVFEVRSNGH